MLRKPEFFKRSPPTNKICVVAQLSRYKVIISVANKDVRGKLFQMSMRSLAKGPGKLVHSLVYLVPYDINRIKACVTREEGYDQELGYCVPGEPEMTFGPS